MAKKITNRFAIVCRFESLVHGWRIEERHATYTQARNARKTFTEPKDYEIVDLANPSDNTARLVREYNGIEL